MRSSKSRSRSKSSRGSSNNRSAVNIVNRVFDSSGPEGKVRGTPQQIIEKYNQLARDAQLSNDRVAAENFQQHAEHYLRMLGEAQREIDARRDQQERENQQRQADRDRQAERDRERAQRQERESNEAPRPSRDPAMAPQPDLLDMSDERDSGLVETPEMSPKPKPKRSYSRKPKPEGGAEPQKPEAAE